MAMPEVSETDFAIIVFREDDQWEADVLPVAVTADLTGFIRVLRQQPSIAGTIGLAGIDDYFFVAIRVLGSQVSLLLSDIAAALDYPLAEQVLEYLEIPVPDEEDIDQVLPAGDLSIFADLGLDEMELAAICSRLDLDSDDDPWDHIEDAVESIADRLGFGPAMERALDLALGALRACRPGMRLRSSPRCAPRSPRRRKRRQPATFRSGRWSSTPQARRSRGQATAGRPMVTRRHTPKSSRSGPRPARSAPGGSTA